jgi:flagellar motor protein MotB
MGLGVGALACAVAGGTGCVRQDQWDDLNRTNAALRAQLQQKEDQLEQERRQMEELRRAAAAGQATAEQMKQLAEAERRAREAQEAKNAELMAKLGGMNFGGLDPQTDAALAALADRFPNILSYDSKRGMLRFASDLTFASGSFELTGEAQNTIGELGRILTSIPEAGQYDVSVVGHTDTQPVRVTAARRFTNNTELSAFRAMEVRKALIAGGLPAERVEFAGFGEHRPAVENSANGNTPANRRVEVFLRPSTFGGLKATPITRPAGGATAPARPAAAGGSGAGTTPTAPAGPRPRPAPEIMK